MHADHSKDRWRETLVRAALIVVVALIASFAGLKLKPVPPRQPKIGEDPIKWLTIQRSIDRDFDKRVTEIGHRFMMFELLFAIVGTLVWGFGDWLWCLR